MNYLLHIGITIAISGILVLGLNLALGVAGLVHLGYTALVGVGAYTSAILLTNIGAPWPLAVLGAIAAAAIMGWVLGLPTREVRGDAFALATFSAAWVFLVAALSWDRLTGGPLGIVGIPRPGFARGNAEFFLLAMGALGVTYAVLAHVTASPFGRVLAALRDDELAARIFGKRTIAAKRTALAIAGGVAGLGGALHAGLIQFIHPSSFWLPMLLAILTALILGGVGNLVGSLAGLAVLTAITEALRFAPFRPEILGPLRIVVASAILLLILLYRPRGMFGKIDVR